MYEQFAKLLKMHGVTTYRVAKDTAIPYSTFMNWKKGISKPKYDKIFKIANYFGVDVSYLLPEYK